MTKTVETLIILDPDSDRYSSDSDISVLTYDEEEEPVNPIIWCTSGVNQQARWAGVPKNTVQMNILAVMRPFPHTPLCISTWMQVTGAPNTTVRHFTGASLAIPDVAPIINKDLTPASVFV